MPSGIIGPPFSALSPLLPSQTATGDRLGDFLSHVEAEERKVQDVEPLKVPCNVDHARTWKHLRGRKGGEDSGIGGSL